MAKDSDGEVHSLLNKNRLEALTDGIFAFAPTVLVLNIEVPAELPIPLPAQPVQALLLHLIPDFTQYLLAFIVLAGFWFTHHRFFDRIRYVDRTLTWLNIFGLIFVALMPFSAQLADTYIDYPLASIIFEMDALFIGMVFFAQWRYASGKENLLNKPLDAKEREAEEYRMIVMPAVSLLGIILAVIGYTWSTSVFITLPVIFLTLRHQER